MPTRARGDDSAYTWDVKLRRFRDPEGKIVSQTKVRSLKGKIVDSHQREARELVRRVYAGDLHVDQFVVQMRARIKQVHLTEYMLGRGGRNVMTASDRGRVGGILSREYRYLQRFANDVRDGKLSEAAAMNRIDLYIDAGAGTYERGYMIAWDVDMPELPPRHPNCACSVTYEEHGRGAEREVWAYWRTGANPCPDCVDKRDLYNPIKFSRPV